MTAKVISFGIQKGGSSKTTTSGVTAHLLSRQYKVLAIDMDSQGNLTEFLGRKDVAHFSGQTVLEAMKEGDVTDYIFEITESLHLVPADDLLATFSRWLYNDHRGGDKTKVLYKALQPVLNQYDFIILDTPPALGDLILNSLSASDRVVAMFENANLPDSVEVNVNTIPVAKRKKSIRETHKSKAFYIRKDIARLIEQDIKNSSRGDMTKIANALFEEYYRKLGRLK